MAILKPTTVEFELADGHKVDLCLSFALLYELKSKHKGLYSRLNTILTKGVTDVMDEVTLLYGCYLCGRLNSAVEAAQLSEVEFMQLCPPDLTYAGNVVRELMNPKNRTASADHLPSEAESEAAE